MFKKKELDQKGEENEASESREWISWKAEDVVLKKQWVDILTDKLKLSEKQFFCLVEFLENYKMIDADDSTVLKMQVAFAVCRKGDFVYIQIPYENDDGKTEYVQHIIKTQE